MNSDLVLIDSWADIDIIPRKGQGKSICPNCSETRKNKTDKCLSINFDSEVANCKHCGIVYKVKSENFVKAQNHIVYPTFKKLPLSKPSLKFFQTRGIEKETLEYFKVTEAEQFMYGKSVETDKGIVEVKDGVTLCLAFNYYFNQKHVNTKFRATYKRFSLVKGSILSFYNIDSIKNSSWCAIQEGEIDTMTAYQCGVLNSISVPNGAAIGANMKLEYVDNCIDLFSNKKKIIIATDGDIAGRALRDELIRRLGAEKCWTIEYPERRT